MQIQKGKRFITAQDGENLNRYFEEIRKYEPLNKEQEKELIIKIQKDNDPKALDALVKANIKFVVSIAKKYQGQGVPLLDLISEGNSGLIEAASRFNVELDLKFFSYAVWWIRIKIFTKMDPNKRMISLPANRQMLVQRVKKEITKLEQDLGRYPTEDELFQQLDKKYSKEDLMEAITYGSKTRSINESIGNEDEGDTLESLIRGDIDTDDTDESKSLAFDLDRFLFYLNQHEYDILTLSLGLNGETSIRPLDIAKYLKVKIKDIPNIKIRAVKRLRKLHNINLLKDYV